MSGIYNSPTDVAEGAGKSDPSGLARSPKTDGREIAKHVREGAMRASELSKAERLDPCLDPEEFEVACPVCSSLCFVDGLDGHAVSLSDVPAGWCCKRCRSLPVAQKGAKKGPYPINLSFLP